MDKNKEVFKNPEFHRNAGWHMVYTIVRFKTTRERCASGHAKIKTFANVDYLYPRNEQTHLEVGLLRQKFGDTLCIPGHILLELEGQHEPILPILFTGKE